jgi:hypothetical protein
MQRVAGVVSQQLSLSCVRVRVEAIEGRSGLPARDLICGAEDTIAKVLRCACAQFGVATEDWRLYTDEDREQELPLQATLAECSISGYASMYLG